MANRNWLVAVAVAAIALGGSLGLAYIGLAQLGSKPVIYTVVRGDTLFEIAQAHSVTVEQLMIWNELDSDLIEVGQELRIFHAETAPEASIPALKPTRAVAGTADEGPPKLVMPTEKPCLKGPELDGTADQEMVASAGLSFDQIKGSMNAFLPNVIHCIQGASEAPEETLMLEITVACTGRVSDVQVSSSGDWSPKVSSCVTDVLRYAPFPAHDLPGGEQFSFPLRYTPG